MLWSEWLSKTNYLEDRSTTIVTKGTPPGEIYNWLCDNMGRVDLTEAVPGRSRWWWCGRMNITHNIIGFKNPRDAALFKLMDF